MQEVTDGVVRCDWDSGVVWEMGLESPVADIKAIELCRIWRNQVECLLLESLE